MVPAWLGWMTLSASLARLGLGLVFVIGLGWVVWLVERSSRLLLAKRCVTSLRGGSTAVPLLAMNGALGRSVVRTSNPLDIAAWYYGRKHRKLNQSAGTVATYSVLFALLILLASALTGCNEIYEMPDGGGEPQLRQQVVRIQKVIRKKYVINPFSAVLFNPPPIEDIKLQIRKLTDNKYRVGYGNNPGSGFATGTARGKVRFIRLEYAGGDWDQDLERNADLNMLLQYGIRTKQRVSDRNETREIARLKNFPAHKSPPFVYITGQRNLAIGSNDRKILREYLIDKHGMLFADNGGSSAWHSQFFDLMRQVLPGVEPIRVPLDHPIHRSIPFVPIVAPHGGRIAYGWVIDSRLAVYYHPGDIGDAWADGHAGVPESVYKACYRLGGNVMLYSYTGYSKWLQTRKKKDDK